MDKKMTAQEIAQNMTAGEWRVPNGYKYDVETNEQAICLSLSRKSNGLQVDIPENMVASPEASAANAQAIVTAVNATYGAGIDPEQIAPLIQTLRKWKRKMWHSDAAKEINAAIESLYITKQDTEK